VETSTALAAFVDVSCLDRPAQARALTVLSRPDVLGAFVTRAIVHRTHDSGEALPEGWSVAGDASPEQACAWAFDTAADANLPLLIAASGATPAAEAVCALVQSLNLDPLFGFAIPRLSDPDTGRLLIPDTFGPGTETAPLRVLASVPDYRILSERVSPLMVIRRELVSNLAFTILPGLGLWPALADYAIRARRAGYRPVLCNRAIVHLGDGQSSRTWGCSEPEVALVRRRYVEPLPPHDGRAALDERLLATAVDEPHTLVIDARNLTPVINGTSVAILGAADALYRARPDSSITLWLHPDASNWYRAESRFPQWAISTTRPSTPHAASLRLSQPWHPEELDVLQGIAAVNVYWMLDSIAWDIGYAAPSGLDATWQRLAAEADGLLFISDFSRRRFENRFTCAPDLRMDSCLLSLDPADYAVAATSGGPAPPYWLVVGNRYDHKHVGPTVDLLARSFPSRSLVVFGDRDQPRAAHVTRFASGQMDEGLVRRCYAQADVVVFPSFYEGFGLPVVEGLSYGRTVVARESSLVAEIAAQYRGPGRLIVYSTERELIEVLGRLDRAEPVQSVALGSNAGPRPWNWDAAAACMLATVAELVAAAPSSQMLRRTELGRGLRAPQR
jgi:glycosyltransferase involved in cell wall biosynthesis